MLEMARRGLKKQGSRIKSTIHIGKEGITDGVIEEIRLQIRKNKLVKIRILPSGERTRDEMARELEKRTSLTLVEIRGNTVLLSEESLFEVE